MSEEGNGQREIETDEAPAEVLELAEACVEYVERELKIRLDYTPETLPLLDHWLTQRRGQLGTAKDEVVALAAGPAGAYLGEVARRILPLRWFAPTGEYRRFRLELRDVFLSMNPIGAAVEVLLQQDAEGWGAALRLLPQDEPRAHAVLENIGEIEEDEYYTLSSRLETMELIADSIVRAHAADTTQRTYDASDYGPLRAEGIADAIGGGSGGSGVVH